MHEVPLVAGADVDDVLFLLSLALPYVAKHASAKPFRSGASYSTNDEPFSNNKILNYLTTTNTSYRKPIATCISLQTKQFD